MRTYNGKVETSLWHCTIGICEGCHYYGYDRGEACMKQLIKEAYQAHLSDERALENQLKKIKEINAENERLRTRNDELNTLNKTATIEAIKGFAERLKEKAFKPLGTWFNEKVVTENCIDNLVKEMAGDNNG